MLSLTIVEREYSGRWVQIVTKFANIKAVV